MDGSRQILEKLQKFGLFNKKSSLSITVHIDLDLIFGEETMYPQSMNISSPKKQYMSSLDVYFFVSDQIYV